MDKGIKKIAEMMSDDLSSNNGLVDSVKFDLSATEKYSYDHNHDSYDEPPSPSSFNLIVDRKGNRAKSVTLLENMGLKEVENNHRRTRYSPKPQVSPTPKREVDPNFGMSKRRLDI